MDLREWQGRKWRAEVTRDSFVVESGAKTIKFETGQIAYLHLERRWLRYRLINDGKPVAKLPGLKNSDAAQLLAWLGYLSILPELNDAVRSCNAAEACLVEQQYLGRWVTTEVVEAVVMQLTSTNLIARVRLGGYEHLLTAEQMRSAEINPEEFRRRVRMTNDEFMAKELEVRRAFFDGIERTPLSDEQARAVVCFDNRVRLLAAAGSGKTSVMVARAAYAVASGYVDPERILLLAFNRAAAEEMQQRIDARFATAGISSVGVKVSTFHAFGLEVIGHATGKKPRISKWLDQGDDIDLVMNIVDQLRDEEKDFQYKWDLYRLLFAGAPAKLTDGEPDGYDRTTGKTGFRTRSGVLVKSHGERMIADFLFYNGVDFEYERSFHQDVSDSTHSQYHPDFYYPEADVWHEHWALDRDHRPPAEFRNYETDMEWKRSLHAKLGTKLVESTYGDVMYGDGLQNLQRQLESYGIEFAWNPDRLVIDSWVRPTKHEDLARLVRTFMCHVKSNLLGAVDIDHRLQLELSDLEGFRSRLFLSCYWPIHDEWQRRLSAEGSVDFEDMLLRAGDILEDGKVEFPYELILVDEFQDSSQARARLVRGLLQKPGRYLLAVGDDWQSINRFAGADISVMSNFDEWFGNGPKLALTTTFRCSQEICDVARTFVSRNPAQLEKSMNSFNGAVGLPVTVILADDEPKAIEGVLRRLAGEAQSHANLSGSSTDFAVDILGRYQFHRDSVPWNSFNGLRVKFRTVHGSKGLEADFVIIMGMSTGTYGFPTSVIDDPVIGLAMPTPENFPNAEERRLLYVALTRARRGVFIMAPPTQPSPFVVELMADSRIVVENAGGQPVKVCPECQRGTLREIHGPYDPFLGCTRFPACRHKEKVSCPGCGIGALVKRHGGNGPFIGCSNYPPCRHTANFRSH
jgi:DNA helicase-4